MVIRCDVDFFVTPRRERNVYRNVGFLRFPFPVENTNKILMTGGLRVRHGNVRSGRCRVVNLEFPGNPFIGGNKNHLGVCRDILDSKANNGAQMPEMQFLSFLILGNHGSGEKVCQPLLPAAFAVLYVIIDRIVYAKVFSRTSISPFIQDVEGIKGILGTVCGSLRKGKISGAVIPNLGQPGTDISAVIPDGNMVAFRPGELPVIVKPYLGVFPLNTGRNQNAIVLLFRGRLFLRAGHGKSQKETG